MTDLEIVLNDLIVENALSEIEINGRKLPDAIGLWYVIFMWENFNTHDRVSRVINKIYLTESHSSQAKIIINEYRRLANDI